MAEGEDQSGLADRLKSALDALGLANKAQPKDNYAFWSTQPVSQFGEEASTSSVRGAWG